MPGRTRQTRKIVLVLISLALVSALFLVVSPRGARAADSYQLKPFPYCGGTHNSGSSDQAGNVYIPCGTSTSSTIYKYTPDGTGTKVTADLGFFASDVAPSPDGKYLYLTKTTPGGSASDNRIRRLTLKPDGSGYVPEDKLSGGTWSLANYMRNGVSYTPMGWKLATDGAGNIYVADGGWTANNDQFVVVKYGSDGTYKTQFGGNARDGGPIHGALTGVAVSNDGSKVYAMESNDATTIPPQGNHLLRFDRQADGAYVLGQTLGGTYQGDCSYGAVGATVSWIGYFSAPWDVGLDGQGNVYVLNTSCYQVLKFDSNLGFKTGMKVGAANTEPTHHGLPHGLAVSKSGEVYVGEASYGNLGQASAKMALPAGDTTAPTVGSVTPQSGATGVPVTSNATATFSEAMDSSTITGSTFTLKKQGTTTAVPAAVTYDPTTKKATLTPSSDLEAGVSYTATVKGGASGVKDVAGNALASDKTWSFTTANVTPPPAGTVCDKWASAAGDDANLGSQASPVRHIPQLISLLSPGQTGCLKAGDTFEEPIGTFIVGNADGTNADGTNADGTNADGTNAGGTATAPITITSSGNPRASINAQGWLKTTSHDIVFKNLDFVGSPGPDKSTMLIIEGDRIKFDSDDISFRRGICINVGQLDGQTGAPQDPAEDFVLEHSRIHNCGTDAILSSTDSGVHGVYLKYTQRAKITNNYIYDNKVRGIQLYPRADGTIIDHNVLDGNSGNLNIGSYPQVDAFSSGTVVTNNVITNSTFSFSKDTAQVHGNYPVGTTDTQYNNVIHDNCIFSDDGQEKRPSTNFDGFGYSNYSNTFADPLYKDRAAKNFELQAGSTCAGKGPQTGGDTTAPTVGSVSPTGGSTGVAASSNATATFSEAMDSSTITGSTFTLTKQGAATPVAATVTYEPTTKKATLDPTTDLEAGVVYTATLKGGSGGVKDAAGNPLASDKVWSFTAQSAPAPPTCSVKGMAGTYKEGTSGPDTILGTTANDVICGLGGDDTVTGGAGDDKMDGGDGTDTVSYQSATAPIMVNLTNHDAWDPATDGLDANIGYDSPINNFENINGSPYDDTLTGDGGSNTINGLGGNDTIYGGAGNDTIYGGAGNDTIKARDGEIDRIYCGSGTDVVEADANDIVAADCDATAPTGTVKINGGALYTRSPYVKLSLPASDSGSGLASMRLMNDGGSWSAWQPYATSKSWTLRNSNGLRSVYVQYKDRAGNLSRVALDGIKLDTIKPTITGMSPRPASITRDTTPTIRATVKDNMTNLRKANIRLYVNGVPIPAWKYGYSATTGALVYNSPRLGKGRKVVRIVARDAAGNAGVRSWYFTIR